MPIHFLGASELTQTSGTTVSFSHTVPTGSAGVILMYNFLLVGNVGSDWEHPLLDGTAFAKWYVEQSVSQKWRAGIYYSTNQDAGTYTVSQVLDEDGIIHTGFLASYGGGRATTVPTDVLSVYQGWTLSGAGNYMYHEDYPITYQGDSDLSLIIVSVNNQEITNWNRWGGYAPISGGGRPGSTTLAGTINVGMGLGETLRPPGDVATNDANAIRWYLSGTGLPTLTEDPFRATFVVVFDPTPWDGWLTAEAGGKKSNRLRARVADWGRKSLTAPRREGTVVKATTMGRSSLTAPNRDEDLRIST